VNYAQGSAGRGQDNQVSREEIDMKFKTVIAAIALASGIATAAPAMAQLKIKVAAPHPTIMPSTFAIIAKEMGFFEREKVEVELLWTAGGADAQQATINGSVDLAVQTGLSGVLSAIQRGAPIAVAGADMTGASDLIWYTRADAPFKTLADLGPNNTASFSRPGASSETVIKSLLEHFKSKARAIPSGSPPETLTQVMSNQIDAGWGTPPLPAAFTEGKVRMLARGNDAPKLAGITTRVHAVNTDFLARNPAAVKAFLRGYDKTIDAMYKDPQVLDKAAQVLKITPALAKQILTDFFPRKAFTIDRIGDLDASIEQAISNKQLKGPLTDAQKATIHKTVAELNAK
jgi:NitT/TauT family transport system substrate-binding protein